ncbi:MAG TPA: hypothetical protein VK498_06335 [Ferruginibacter sp.]|nr:hypothetical protein [Ferruginibacter sp.]
MIKLFQIFRPSAEKEFGIKYYKGKNKPSIFSPANNLNKVDLLKMIHEEPKNKNFK